MPATDLEFLLSEQSPLKQVIPGFYLRQEQLLLAEKVMKTLHGRIPLVIQAGTGAGKTLGYLLPAMLSGLKIIVSTGTRTLQEQISHKELPWLQKAIYPDLSWSILKGRTNYTCCYKLTKLFTLPDLALAGSYLGTLKTWLKQTITGDLDEIREFFPEAFLSDLVSDSEQCKGSRCSEREACFLLSARRKAAESQILVINHHLFMAHLALKASGFGEVLPKFEVVIFDEAHLLPEIATQAFGLSVSQPRVSLLLKNIGAEASQTSLLTPVLNKVKYKADIFFDEIYKIVGKLSAVGLPPQSLSSIQPKLENFSQELSLLLSILANEPDENLATRVAVLQADLQTVTQAQEGHSVVWGKSKGGVALILSPVDIGPHLQEALYEQETRLIFTSATLAPLDDLTPFIERMGLPENTSQLSLPSPFDLANQAKLYVPKHLPEPSDKNFAWHVSQEVKKLLLITQGRAFVLFTSHRNLEQVASLLGNELPYTILVQGQGPKLEMLKRFVEESPAVLLATASFWQGVDVPGPSLSAVIIDKLPFSPPDDPILEARYQLVQKNGKQGFQTILLPEAILSLKQGLGRLIRTADDKGILAVLDSRIWSKNYGKQFLKALAPIPVTSKLSSLKQL